MGDTLKVGVMADHPGFHLIGSVAMESAEPVFQTVAGVLKPWLKRIPDRETGQSSCLFIGNGRCYFHIRTWRSIPKASCLK